MMFLAFAILLGVFQTTVMGNLFSSGIPNLLLVMIIFWTAEMRFENTWKQAVFFGTVLDILQLMPVGSNIFAMLMVAFVVSSIAKRFLVAHGGYKIVMIAILTALGTICYDSSLFMASKISELTSGVSSFLFAPGEILAKILNNLLVFALIYIPLKKIEHFFILKGKSGEFANVKV